MSITVDHAAALSIQNMPESIHRRDGINRRHLRQHIWKTVNRAHLDTVLFSLSKMRLMLKGAR